MDKDILQQEVIAQAEIEAYRQMVKETAPKPPVIKNVFWAFIVGGFISLMGQLLINLYRYNGLTKLEAGAAASATLVFAAALLTGLGVYDNMAKYAGAGMIVPITGFANSMVSPALEFKKEGMIFGVGARIFTLAGPVIIYGLITAWLAGLIVFLFS